MPRVVAWLFGIVLLCAGPVPSEAVSITGGVIDGFPGHGLSMSLTGDGFGYTGGGGDWTPAATGLCEPVLCSAGMVQPFHQVITGGDQFIVGGTGQYQGTAFSVGWPPTGALLQLEFSGTYTVPSSPVGTWTIQAPFAFSGFIQPTNQNRIELSGGGTLTLTSTNQGFPPGWTGFYASEIRYDFLQPVPEPTTVGLFGIGFGALGLWRWRRVGSPASFP